MSEVFLIQHGRIEDGCHHQVEWEWISLSQIELVWAKSQSGVRVFWVNLREDKKVSESKMAVSESNMVEFKMAAIIKLSQNEWVKVFFVQMVGTNPGKFERKNKGGWIQDGQIQDGRILDGYHHQVEWEWMSFSQIELLRVRVRVEWECFGVNLREENKMSVYNMSEFKMTAIIKLSQNEWVKFS